MLTRFIKWLPLAVATAALVYLWFRAVTAWPCVLASYLLVGAVSAFDLDVERDRRAGLPTPTLPLLLAASHYLQFALFVVLCWLDWKNALCWWVIRFLLTRFARLPSLIGALLAAPFVSEPARLPNLRRNHG